MRSLIFVLLATGAIAGMYLLIIPFLEKASFSSKSVYLRGLVDFWCHLPAKTFPMSVIKSSRCCKFFGSASSSYNAVIFLSASPFSTWQEWCLQCMHQLSETKTCKDLFSRNSLDDLPTPSLIAPDELTVSVTLFALLLLVEDVSFKKPFQHSNILEISWRLPLVPLASVCVLKEFANVHSFISW